MNRWPALMPASEASEYLGCCRSKFERYVSAGLIPYVLPGDTKWRMYRRTDLDAFLSSLQPQTAA